MFQQALQKFLPPFWKYRDVDDYRQIPLSTDSPFFHRLESSMFGIHGLSIKQITLVESPYLYGQFLMKKAEYETRGKVKVIELFHATGAHNVHSILSNNLDWRLVRRMKFGMGVSFSPYPEYAHREASWTCGINRAMIVADVLVGSAEDVSYSSVLPGHGTDTTTGNGKHVYVKYYDNEFFPKHVIYYDNFGMMERCSTYVPHIRGKLLD